MTGPPNDDKTPPEATGSRRTAHFQFDGRPFEFCAATPNDHLVETMRRTGTFYESDLLVLLRELLRRRDTGTRRCFAVDAGAYIGTHTVFLAAFGGLDHVRAFEPNPTAATALARNLTRNGVSGRVRLRRGHSATTRKGPRFALPTTGTWARRVSSRPMHRSRPRTPLWTS